MLADGLSAPRRAFADRGEVFVAEAGPLNQTGGRLLRVPGLGGALVVLAEQLGAPDAVTADADAAYVVDTTGVWRVPRSGGARTLIDSTVNAAVAGETDLALVDGGLVFATGQRWLVRVGRSGENRVLLHTGPPGSQVRAVRPVGAGLYFLLAAGAESGIYRVPQDGSAAATLARSTSADARSLELAGGDLLLAEGTRLVRIPLDGNEPVSLAEGLEGPRAPLEFEGAVYFKDATTLAGPGSGFFQRVNPCSPGVAEPLGISGSGPGALAADGEGLVFTSAQSGGGGFVGRVF